MLLLVYFFEYVCSVGLAQIANTNRSTHVQDRDYVMLATCYQLGVFISRSSIAILEIPYFGTLTTLQGINMMIWSFHCEYNLFNEYVQFALMVYVGLLGGAMYVNVFYHILSDPTIDNKDRELCINMASICLNLGVTFSCCYELIMDNTFFKDLVERSH